MRVIPVAGRGLDVIELERRTCSLLHAQSSHHQRQHRAYRRRRGFREAKKIREVLEESRVLVEGEKNCLIPEKFSTE